MLVILAFNLFDINDVGNGEEKASAFTNFCGEMNYVTV